LRVSPDLVATPEPTDSELRELRKLNSL